MMYPFMTLNDETEIVHSDMQNDGRVKVYIEMSDGELRETQTADYFSKQRRSDCAFGEIDAR